MRSFRMDLEIGKSQAKINKTRMDMHNGAITPEDARDAFKAEYTRMATLLDDSIETSSSVAAKKEGK